MNREEFLKQLESLLLDLTYEEREEAMDYYRNYFEDAGEENEANVIAELESPQKVAQSIKESLDTSDNSTVELPPVVEGEVVEDASYTHTNTDEKMNWWEEIKDKFNKMDNTAKWILLALGILFLVPVLSAAIGAVLGFLGTIIGVVFGIFGVAIGGIFGGVTTAIGGIVTMCTGALGSGFLVFGIGMILIAVGIGCVIVLCMIGMYLIPWLIGWIKRAFQYFLPMKNGGDNHEK